MPESPQTPYRIWTLSCPFKKSGVPVMGTFGHRLRSVVVMDLTTWQRLCADVPQLATTTFEVGTVEE